MSSTQVDIIKPDAAQVDKIAQLLALAFENSAVLSQICQAKGKELRRRLHLLFRARIAMQVAANQPMLGVIKDAQVISVAVFQEPGSYFPVWEQIRCLLQVIFGISPLVAWRIWRNLIILERYHPSEPHYYLTPLGVHPDFQGKGYARTLLEALHARSEAHPLSTGVYLDTGNPRIVSFYERFGYHTTAQLKINNMETFMMFRPNTSK
ncbi:acetyltransferase (plasmid) [Cylindrospermum stagnale PCC 7417]|uniref:Acetyltransferase n=1 Tax=Cylindrospermum stagnale PCC 7417 TaxID=56107 RepID=K9X8J7_9NOST|nr:N-acetyltransferase [Cylindrospermum stagnale]AFZ28429.1 acetyltransferase [Cylindrospermum stagnale PCC 7417]